MHGGRRERSEPSFKFQAAWMLHGEFGDFIRNNWSPNENFNANSKALVPKLQEWNKEVFGIISKRKNRLLARIERIQRKVDKDYEARHVKLERKLKKELMKSYIRKKLFGFKNHEKTRLFRAIGTLDSTTL